MRKWLRRYQQGDYWPQARALELPWVQYTAREVRSGLLFLAFAQGRSWAASEVFAARVRPNSHKDYLSPWQIIARLASAWPLELCLLPPVFLDYYIIWATDFFTVTTARLQTFYVLFFMELRRRHLMLFNVTEHPQAERAVHQLRNLSLQHDHFSRFIFHDRDGKFSEEFDAFAQASRTQIIKLPARSPN